MQQETPSLDAWISELKAGPLASGVGMYLVHNGVVRGTARDGSIVTGMELSYDEAHLAEIIKEVEQMEGVIYVKAWLNKGTLQIGDDIMYTLVAGDSRPHVITALTELVRRIKTEVVKEIEHH